MRKILLALLLVLIASFLPATAATAASIPPVAVLTEDEEEWEEEEPGESFCSSDEEVLYCTADIGVRSEVQEIRAAVGATVSYDLEVYNDSELPAEVQETIINTPYNMSLTNVSSDTASCEVETGSGGFCTIDAVEPGSSYNIQVTGKVLKATATPTSIEAYVYHGGEDPNIDNDEVYVDLISPLAVRKCVVPALRGMSLKAARVKLNKSGCRVGKLVRPKKVGLNKLRVKRTLPTKGKVLNYGSRVALVLKK